MQSPRRPLAVFVELAIEALITGAFMQIGESAVTETIKFVKRRRKKRKEKDDGPLHPPG